MAFEWQSVTGSLRVKNPKVWKALGVLYITSFIASLLYIRSHEYGLWWLVYLLVVIWSTDTGAYICGITFGGAKIAPKISPSKSWTGFIGGVIASALAVQLLIYLTDLNLLNQAGDIWVTIFISIVGQIGDLAESYWKRRFKVKDSGDIIPGHGGVLDRMDSLVFASVALVLIMITMS
jgi:phosphatidate cytidylyltransferase